jgi:hypothetical protein
MMMMMMMMNLVGLVARSGESRGAYRVLLGKLEGKGPLGRTRHRWEDNIKCSVKKSVARTWTRLIWLMIVPSGGLL